MPAAVYRDGGRLTRLAKEAAEAYLVHKQDLTEKIAELATRHVLNRHEVERVVEQADHMVHLEMRKTSSVVEFPIARIEKILPGRPASSFIHTEKTARTKVAAEIPDDFFDDPIASRQLHQTTQARIERAKLAREDAVDAAAMAEELLVKAAFAFKQSLRDYADEGDLAEAMEAFAEHPKLAAEPDLLFRVASMVKKAGLELNRPVTFTDRTMVILTTDERQKVAEAVESDYVPSGLSMSGMPVAVINGEHQVWRDLDTLIDQYKNNALCIRGIVDSNDVVNFLEGPAKTRFDAAVHQAGRVV